MKTLGLLIGAFLTAVPVATLASEQKPYTLTISAEAYNPNDTYDFAIFFRAAPCVDVTYNIRIPIAGVKNSEEALSKAEPQIQKMAQDLAKDKERCEKHE